MVVLRTAMCCVGNGNAVIAATVTTADSSTGQLGHLAMHYPAPAPNANGAEFVVDNAPATLEQAIQAVNMPGTGRASGEDDLDIDEIGNVLN